jgi:hypothetical protein
MALAVLSKVTGSGSAGNAAAKARTYSGIDWSTATSTFSLGMAISMGFRIGPLACSSTSAARPSQNCATCPAAL